MDELVGTKIVGRKIECPFEEPFEIVLRRFNKYIEKAGILREYKERQYYVKPSQKRREKRFRAQTRERRRQKEE